MVVDAIQKTDIRWISNQGEAEWIQGSFINALNGLPKQDRFTKYRKLFTVESIPPEAYLSTEVFYDLRVELNNVVLHDYDAARIRDPVKNTLKTLDLAPYLLLGDNELILNVKDNSGTRIVKASAPTLRIYTNTHSGWEFTNVQGIWQPVVPATYRYVDMSPSAENTNVDLLRSIIPFLVGLFLLLFWGMSSIDITKHDFSLLVASRMRWVIMIGVLVLGLNNCFRLDINNGMDNVFHYQYLNYLLEHKSIPLASEGVFAFRSPLFYMIALLPMAFFQWILGSGWAAYAIRLVPVIMGLMQTEILYRIAKHLYPTQPRAIMLMTCIGTFLPINLYMSQFVGDEPAAGCTGSLVILMALYLLKNNREPTTRESILAGALLGLAFLSKVTTFLLMPPCVLIFLVCHLKKEGLSTKMFLKNLAFATMTCLNVAGWFYVRNWIRLGTFVPIGWDTKTYTW